MNDQDKTKEQLIEELAHLRQWNTKLETQLSRSQQAEADQRQINNSLPVLVGTAGLDGYYKEVNAAFERILGWSEHESSSRPFLEFVHPEDRAASSETFAGLKAGTPALNFPNRNLCKDGSYRWINWTVIPVPDRDLIFGIGQDITERKRAEEAIRESEQQMRLHVQQTPLAVIEWDMNARVAKWNPAAERIFGYTAEEAIGRHYSFFLPATARKQMYQVRNALLAKTGGERSTNENITKDGRTILCEWYLTPLVNADGQVIGAASLAQDITERSRMEAALRASEAKYRRLHQSMRDAFVSVDMSGRIQEFNDAYRQMLGYEPEELLARTYVDLTPEKWHSFEARIVQEQILNLGYSCTYEKEYRRKDGTVFPVELRTSLLTDDDGNPTSMWAIVRDITDRKQAERALQEARDQLEQRVLERTAELSDANERLQAEVEQRRQSEAKYRALVESSPDAVVMVDLQGQILFASQRAADLHGFRDPDEMVGRPATDFLVAPERDRAQTNIGRLIGEGGPRTVEHTLLRTDGTTFQAEVRGAVIWDATGKAVASLAVCRDITERKQAEEKLKREQQALRRMLLASDHERHLITYELHDGVAQQLLGAKMLLESQQPSKGRKPKAADAYREGIAALVRAATEVRWMMNWLRTPVLDKFGLAEAIEDVASQLRLRPDAPEIEYRPAVKFKRLEPTLENTLFRIAQEAMTNACRHSQSGKVRVKLTQKGDDVTLEVRDWGIGFDQSSVQEYRFGLEGIRERARIMGGKLSIKTAPGEGTTVKVTFPVVEPAGEE